MKVGSLDTEKPVAYCGNLAPRPRVGRITRVLVHVVWGDGDRSLVPPDCLRNVTRREDTGERTIANDCP